MRAARKAAEVQLSLKGVAPGEKVECAVCGVWEEADLLLGFQVLDRSTQLEPDSTAPRLPKVSGPRAEALGARCFSETSTVTAGTPASARAHQSAQLKRNRHGGYGDGQHLRSQVADAVHG